MNAGPAQLVGRVLGGRYRLDRVIGKGGMGVVFQATQLDLTRGVGHLDDIVAIDALLTGRRSR